jgi:cardiolipin synthase
VFHASRSNYDRLLVAGVRIFERTDALLHAKTAVIDGVWSTVGSANLDMRSFIHNSEVNAVVVGRDFGRRMEELFRDDLAHTEEITLATWRDRSVFDRLKEQVCKRFNYWL